MFTFRGGEGLRGGGFIVVVVEGVGGARLIVPYSLPEKESVRERGPGRGFKSVVDGWWRWWMAGLAGWLAG